MKQRKTHVKVGDNVMIISGFYKNQTGQVMRINKKTGKLVVKGINFIDLIDAGNPVEQAKIYDEQGADELCFRYNSKSRK